MVDGRVLVLGLAAALLAASGPAGAQPTNLSSTAAREAVLTQAEQALDRGDVATALVGFERAAGMLHAADTEMGLVRTQLQAGRYRLALASCAHAAGAHLEEPSAAALYAWLLRAGGQTGVASRTLDDALRRYPDNAVLIAVRHAFAQPLPLATGVLLEVPQRMAPAAWMLRMQTPPPADSQVVGTAVLLAPGSRALLPGALLRAHQGARLWLRNGLGETTEARVDAAAQPLAALGLGLLQLATPLDAGSVQTATREPFAGSPGAVAQYSAASTGNPAWPWLRQGFLGGIAADNGPRLLGIDVPEIGLGGAVFDANARLVGVALAAPDGRPLFIPATAWAAMQQQPADAASGPSPLSDVRGRGGPRWSVDEAYENALRVSLQVIVSMP